MKRILIALALLLSLSLAAQTDWKTIDKLMDDGSYKTAYAEAEKVFKRATRSNELLTASLYMAEAAENYQEDCADSAIARYRSILPRLEAPERAVCYAWLGVADSALMEKELLKQTSAERIKSFLEREEHGKRDVNLTPTVFDVVAQHILNNVVYDNFALMQELIDFHSRENDDIRIMLDLQLMRMIRAHRPNEVTGEEWLQRYINKYRGSKSQQVTNLYCEMARVQMMHDRYVEAVAYCDTAIMLFPMSSGAVECFNMRKEILAQRIDIQTSYLTIAGRPSLHVLEFKNLSKVHLALYPYRQMGRDFEFPDKLPKPLKVWQLEVDDNGDHKEKKAIFHLPALEMGTYLLVASEDEKFSQTDAYSVINSTDFLLLRNGEDFQLVEAVSGDPIEGQEVVMLDWYEQKPVDTAISYPDGRFRMKAKNQYMSKLNITRGGHPFVFNTYSGYIRHSSRTMTEQAELLTDRPIYRPGDTAHIAVLLYESDGVDGRTVGGRELSLRIDTPNGKRYVDWKLRTDAHGVSDTVFVIPTEVLTGQWAVTLHDEGRKPSYLGYVYLRVEEYKQPKFMVTIDDPTGRQDAGGPSLGEPYTLRGRATAYSGTNLGGAKVRYTVTRETYYWFRGYDRLWNYSFTDSTTTATDGSFDITFTPQPDSGIDLSRKPNFRFRVNVDVTDLNGETHSASASFVIGYCNEQVAILSPRHDISALNQVQFSYTDLNRHPLSGKVHLNLYHLRQPDTLRLEHPVIAHNSDAQMTLSRSEFRRLFPQYAYSLEEYNNDLWESDLQYSTTLRPDGTKDIITVPIEDKKLPSGLYRIVAWTDNVADTVYVCLSVPKEKEIANVEILWAHFDTTSAAPGDRVTLSYASAFEGTRFFYTLTGPDGDELDSRWLPAGRRIKRLTIPIDSSMLGGIHVRLTTVRDGIDMEWTEKVDVPFTHKRLNVDIATFRDKLLPGEQEQWTIKVKGESRKVKEDDKSAHLIMTMYDDALNSYGSRLGWGLTPWRTNFINNYSRIDLGRYNNGYHQQFEYQNYDGPSPYSLTLRSAFIEAYRFRGRRMYKNAGIRRNAAPLVEEEEEIFAVTDASTARGESNMVTMQGNVRKRTANYEEVVLQTSAEDEVDEAAPTSDLTPPTSLQLRTNLSSLAFFVSDLRTDSTGTAIYSFRVPELLTRWNVRGLAFTDDLKIGTLDKSLVTSKPLMVQPNIPRFLRQGDSIVLMAKVILNNEELRMKNEELPVVVYFLLTDAATGDTITLQHCQVTVKDAAQVTCAFRVPKDVYVVTYEVTAATKDGVLAEGRYSDGERGQIPVVSSRQAVTLSQPVYINGAGEKSFHFSLSDFHSPTAEPHFLGAELVSNPVWLAIKSMPYLKQQENPSTIFLANSLYVNTLAKEIIDNFNFQFSIFNLTDTSNTRLRINEDVKQTLLDATPWLRDAESEVEQRQAIANYFDSTRLTEEFAKLNAQLTSRQNSDGGWSWMPEGESSTWVTMQVLKKLNNKHLTLNTDKALAYVDREEQRCYEKYIKPYLKKYKWEPDNIEYLYTRSFYGKSSTEAYKFYYKNALKNYRKYNGLYTQAQLALIFQRHGDNKAARDLIRRLKEKSLESDEMGMYWRDNRSGWCWYERPIETQALLIQAFREVTPQDTAAIALMQQWLLKQKQTTHWGNDRATVEAINALVAPNTPSNPNTLSALKSTTLTLCGVDLTAPSEGLEGYRSQRWEGPALDSIIALDDSTVTLRKVTPGIAWGAVYYQYTDDMDKMPSSENGITLKRTYLDNNNQNILNAPNTLKVGDRIKVRIEISCDRTMEYLELIDGRPSCVEPLSTRAGWNWNQGLRYYVEVKNTATHCYINRLEKGRYVVEYDVYVTNPGTFLAGPVTMQCMYAPEFRATAPAFLLKVEK